MMILNRTDSGATNRNKSTIVKHKQGVQSDLCEQAMPSDGLSTRQRRGLSFVEIDLSLLRTFELCLVCASKKEVWEKLREEKLISVAYSTYNRSIGIKFPHSSYADLRKIALERTDESSSTTASKAKAADPVTKPKTSPHPAPQKNDPFADIRPVDITKRRKIDW